MSEESSKEILSKTILKQQGNPDDIAKAVHFLILKAEYITSQVLTIDDGRTLYLQDLLFDIFRLGFRQLVE